MAGRKKEFAINKNSVSMLLCGPTVYDYAHVGHARMLLFYDMVARYFKQKGVHVRVVVNITDIDHKIFGKARSAGSSPHELATRFINELLRDLSSLGITDFTFARVSDYGQVAQELILQLVNGGKAYSAGGNVYLDTAGTESFGRLARMARQDLDDCRLDISPAKKSPADILLWNASEHFDILFHSKSLGNGIPWWHMQDSSVAMANFGGVYDIHGGANELAYPHHTSHLAQLKALTALEMPVSFWTHIGLVCMKGRKMSKSLGNTVKMRDLLKRHSANAIRLYLYSKHYRKAFDFVEKDIEKCEQINYYISTRHAGSKSKFENRFFDRIEDDFDTPGALKVIVEAAKSCKLSFAMVSTFGLQY
jgi:cysteinyl-tRNA synthetase